MGVNVCFCNKESDNVIKESSVDCYKKYEQAYLDNVIISNNININHKTNSTNENLEDKKMNKKKYKKIFNENNGINNTKNQPLMNSSYTNNYFNLNQTLTDEKYIQNIIKIQSYFRSYLEKKNNKENYEKELEKDEHLSLKINLEINDIVFSSNSLSNLPRTQNNENNNINKDESNVIIPFNLTNKLKMNYKYSGYLKKVSKQKRSKSLKNFSEEYIGDNEKLDLNKEGFGKFIFNDGTEFCGIFQDNILQKYGKYSNINGKNKHNLEKNEKEIIITDNLNYEEFTGEYKNYVSDGFGIYKNYITNLKIIGIFHYNGLSGIGIEDSVEGGYVYYGEFINNKKEGYGTIIWKDGNKYQGEFNNNQLNGHGIIEFPGNKYYQGEIKNGRMEGFGEFFWKNEKKYIGNYKNDKRNGFGVFISKSNDFPNTTLNDLNNHANNDGFDLGNISAYIGFWKNGNMDGFGIKVWGQEIKYGLWENGTKKKYLESNIMFRTYFKWIDKKYNKLFLGSQIDIFKFLDKCININNQISPIKQENS